MATPIKNINQLDIFLHKKKKFNFYIEFQEFNSKENGFWSHKINKNYLACGCTMGKIFTGVSLLLIVLYTVIFIDFDINKMTYKFYVSVLLVIVFFALLGKYLGKRVAYQKLNRDIKDLKQKLNNIQKGE